MTTPRRSRQSTATSESTVASDDALLSIPQVAILLNIRPTKVATLIAAGRLPALKLGHRTIRIRQGDLRRMLNDLAAAGAGS